MFQHFEPRNFGQTPKKIEKNPNFLETRDFNGLDWPSNESDDGSDSNWDAQLYNEDGMKSAPASEIGSDMDVDGEDRDYCLDSVFLDDEVFLEKVLTQAEDVGDSVDGKKSGFQLMFITNRNTVSRRRRYLSDFSLSVSSLDFHLRTSLAQHITGPAQGSYKRGPNLGSKPACTKHHYKDQLAKQQNLNRFGFSMTQKPKQSSLQPKPRDFADDIPNINVGGAESDIDILSVHSECLTGSAARTMSVEGEPDIILSDADDSAPSSRHSSPLLHLADDVDGSRI
ncbi:hypothetical protein B0H10DRAFT_1950831 [Mycena sp. CBHHK59/15]|nr:hypothetical protein B0H10DRAFT_1950831 [Mycena sp. CBHHK59/15]